MDQRMVMAPRMIQSMEILQLPLLALQERIEQEMLENPVLELREREPSVETSPTEERYESEHALKVGEDKNKADDFERLNNVDEDWNDYMSRSSYVPRSGGGVDADGRDRKLDAMANTAAPAQNLNEYLHDQWAFVEADDAVKAAGTAIIDHIEDTGYLRVELASVQEHVRQKVTAEQLEEALRLVQILDPTGVGARNLGECMLIQLANMDGDYALAMELIRDHLKDIEMNRFPAIAKKTGHEIAEIQDALKVVARLDTRPGLQIGRHDVQYVTPDVIVDYDEENDIYVARLADGSMPDLRISRTYTKMMKDGGLSGDAKDFLRNNVRSARWIIESIEQRKTTLLRVVNHVLANQRDFFDKGAAFLRPLPMVDVAETLGIHVGTVSRAVSGKYMQTPIGIFPLRYFFSGGTENAAGESVSWDAIKAKLQEIVDNEDKNNPFNDDDLVDELKKKGIKLARRTVAKYRGLMNIPPARRRKQFV